MIVFDIIAILHFIVIVTMIIVLEAAVFFVIAFGCIAAAIVVLLGPVFIPFFIVPKMEWLFWGWFKAFLQYSFYPVVANAYLFVFGSMLVHLVDSHPPPYDGATIALLFAPLLFLLIAFTCGVVKIPSLVSSLFSGSSGSPSSPRFYRRQESAMSEITNLMTSPDANLASARRQFVELYGMPLIAASYLRIALACVSAVCLGLLILNVKTFQAFHNFKPLVIRISDVGRADAVVYDALT